MKGKWLDVMDWHISAAMKMAVLALGYLAWGFPINFIDTHSHWSGGAYALSLAGYTN